MSSGDNYEYEKSNIPQDIDAHSPYVEKQQSSFVNDLNNNVYANSSLSLVQFDIGQMVNSSSVWEQLVFPRNPSTSIQSELV